MINKTTLKIPVSLVILIYLTVCSSAHVITVNPPTDLQIIDPGHLGQLYVRWHPPASLENRKDCTVRYQLQYFNTYDGEWETIRTSHLNYTAQFNLGKETRVKVQTLLRGQCVNGTDLLSVPTEKTLLSSENGPTESKVTDFACIFYHREYMECNWKKGKEAPPHSKYSLFYWHKKMNQAMECPKYIQTNGVNTGCNFTSNSLMEFTEFNICVNGSSKETPLRPTYFMLQLQNIVKPAALEILNITALENAKIRLKWTPIKGKIPNHCLEYEIQHRQEGQEWISQQITESTFIIFSIDQHEKHCFRVRSKLNIYCADSNVWSDWSKQHCIPDARDPNDTSVQTMALCVLATMILFTLTLFLWIRRQISKGKGVKEGILLGVECEQKMNSP